MKRSMCLVLALIFSLVFIPAFAAQATGEGESTTKVSPREVTMNLTNIDRHDYSSGSQFGVYYFRPTASGNYTFSLLSPDCNFDAKLYRLDSTRKAAGTPLTKASKDGEMNISIDLKRSERYMLVVGENIKQSASGNITVEKAPKGTVQMMVMYNYKGHSTPKPYALGINSQKKERIRTPYQTEYYKFTALYSGTYTFKTTGSMSFQLLNSKGYALSSSKTHKFKKNEVYFIRLHKSGTKTGAYTVTAELSKPDEEVLVGEVQISAKKKTLADGKNFTLKAKALPTYATNRKIIWESSNPEVAKVSSTGKVTAVAPGTATIRAKADSGASATCTVKVTSVKLKSISMKKSASLKAGKTGTLKVTYKPANASVKDLKWSSSKTSVATVDQNGTITAIKPGKTTITAVSKDGSRKARCTLTVKRP